MSENHRLQRAKSKTNAKRKITDAAETLFMSSSDVLPSSADAQTPRQNKSISAAHPAIYLNTRSHKMLRRAIRIWKMPIPVSNYTGAVMPKLRSFQERVEMLRNRSGESDRPKPMTRSVRDLQLCSSGTDSSPSPSSSSQSHGSLRRRTVHLHRTRRYRKQLRWYRMLSSNRRRRQNDERLRRRQAQPSPECSSCVKGEHGDDGTDSASTQSPPAIRAPTRKTSRRLWRRQLDSSSSDNSPMTANLCALRPHTPADKHTISFAGVESKTSDHSRSFDSNVSDRDSSDLKAVQTNEKSAEKPLKIPASVEEQSSVEQHMHERPPDSEESLVSQLIVFKGDLRRCEASADVKQQMIAQEERVEIKTSPISSRHTDAGRPSCVKWKKVLVRRALGSSTSSDDSRDPTHQFSGRFTPAGQSDANRRDATSECHDRPAEDHIKRSAAGDSVTTPTAEVVN